MKDLIDRQAAIRAVNTALFPKINTAKDAEKALRDLPSAQPERKHGKWVFVRGEEAGNALYMCSECGKGDIHAPEVRVPYCWHCGAQMGEEA